MGMLPFLPSVIPVVVAGGALGPTSGLTPWETIGLAMAANSGTVQFIVFSLVLQDAGLVTIFLTTLVLGLRMLVYSTVLRAHLEDVPGKWKPLVAFGLIDALFFVAIEKLRDGSLRDHKHWYFLGGSAIVYGTWMTCTAVGAFLSTLILDVQSLGLDFPMTALFVAMLVLSIANRKLFTIAAVAGVTAMLARGLPFNLGVLVATAAGVAVGGVWDAVARYRATIDPVSSSTVETNEEADP
ncbi:hypothetical protein C5C13_11740 [Clavibacter michiganensis]|nr:hypothetical protein C5C13_11740 [Clavibacter michiganensis]